MARASTIGLALAATFLVAMNSAAQEMGPAHPNLPKLADFLRYVFDSVPASSVSAAVSRSICREMDLTAAADPGVVEHLFICEVDLGCGVTGEVPVWVLKDETLAFAPDSPEQVVFYACPDSISDPVRRATIEQELALPPPTITRIK